MSGSTLGALIYKLGLDGSELRSAIGDVKVSFSQLEGVAASAAKIIGGFSGAALVKQTIEYADSLDELATGAGVAVEAIQRLGYAASQSHSDIEGVYKALQNMSQKLADGKMDETIERLGLSVSEIEKMSPDEQMLTFADALKAVGNQAEFAKAGSEIFGKSWKEMAPAIKAGMREVADEATVMTEKTVKSVGALGDAWDTLKKSTYSLTAAIVSPFAAGLEMINNLYHSTESFANTWKDSFSEAFLGETSPAPRQLNLKLPQGDAGGAKDYANWELKGIYADLEAQYDRAREAVKKLQADQERLLDLQHHIFGQTAIDEATRWLSVVGDVTDWRRIEGEQLETLRKKLTDAAFAYERLGDKASASAARSAAAATYISARSLAGYGLTPTVVPGYQRWIDNGFGGSSSVTDPDVMQALAFQTWSKMGSGWFSNVTTSGWAKNLSGLAKDLQELGRVVGSGQFAQSVQSIANIVGAMDLGTGIGKSLTSNGKIKLTASNLLTAGLQGIVAMQQATSSGSAAMDIIGGAATGASIGANPALMTASGGMSVLVGAAAGGIYGAIAQLFKPSAADEANAKANEQIANARASLLQTYGTTDALAKVAKQLNVDLMGVWGDTGTSGLNKFNAALLDFNNGLQRNQKLVSDLEALKPGGLLAKSVEAVMKGGSLTDETRTAVGNFITGQTANLSGYLTSYMQHAIDSAAAMEKAGLKPVTNGLMGASGEGFSAAATATIRQMQLNGMGFSEIAAALGPTLTEFSNRSGIDTSLFDVLKQATNSTIAPILGTVSDTGNIVATLSNLSRMDQTTFKNLTSGLADAYQELVGQGVQGNDALTMMQPTLQKIWEVSERGALAVSDSTQKLLDQAMQNGIIGAAYKASTDQMKDSIDALTGAIATLTSTLSGSVLTTPNTGSGTGGAGGSTIYDYGFIGKGSQIPEFRDGTDGFQYFGNGKLAMLHGWEAVIRPGDVAPSTGRSVSADASRGGDLLPVTINVDGDALIRAFVRVGKRQGWTN